MWRSAWAAAAIPGLRTDLLMEETFFAVCSAALVDDPVHPLREPADLRHHTLLHEIVDTIPDYITWDSWLAASVSRASDTSRGPAFPHTYLTLQAAASGQGVALATNVLIGDYLEAGRLARPFPQEVKGPINITWSAPRRPPSAHPSWRSGTGSSIEARAAGQLV